MEDDGLRRLPEPLAAWAPSIKPGLGRYMADEISALYRPLRRALVANLVRAKVLPSEQANWIRAHVTADVESQHQEKFVSDVLAELNTLDASRIGGLGITRQELEAWQAPRQRRDDR